MHAGVTLHRILMECTPLECISASNVLLEMRVFCVAPRCHTRLILFFVYIAGFGYGCFCSANLVAVQLEAVSLVAKLGSIEFRSAEFRRCQVSFE